MKQRTPPKEGEYVTVLGIDTGFRHLGWAAVGMTFSPKPQDLHIWAMGYMGTDKLTGKQKGIPFSTDVTLRAQDIYGQFKALVGLYGPKVIAIESMSFVRSATTMAQMGACYGAIACTAKENDLPLLEATPQAIKKAVCGKNNAEKPELQHQLNKMFDYVPQAKLEPQSLNTDQLPHPYDGLGAVVAMLDHEVMRFIRSTLK